MGLAPTRRTRAHARAPRALAAAALALALGASASPAGAAAKAPAAPTATAAACANANTVPADMSRTAARRATLCLLNAERRRRGLGGLRGNRLLTLAAQRHAADMVARGYFSHDSQDGRDFVERILDAGYVDREAGGWTLGENLAWGGGSLASPAKIVRAWMASPGHRANILRRGYREIGVGVALGVPVAGIRSGATYATEFGRRR